MSSVLIMRESALPARGPGRGMTARVPARPRSQGTARPGFRRRRSSPAGRGRKLRPLAPAGAPHAAPRVSAGRRSAQAAPPLRPCPRLPAPTPCLTLVTLPTRAALTPEPAAPARHEWRFGLVPASPNVQPFKIYSPLARAGRPGRNPHRRSSISLDPAEACGRGCAAVVSGHNVLSGENEILEDFRQPLGAHRPLHVRAC